jgi:hypothetical protein
MTSSQRRRAAAFVLALATAIIVFGCADLTPVPARDAGAACVDDAGNPCCVDDAGNPCCYDDAGNAQTCCYDDAGNSQTCCFDDAGNATACGDE